MSSEDLQPCDFDPVYIVWLGLVETWHHECAILFTSLHINDLLWFTTVNYAHATEIPSRVFGSLKPFDLDRVLHSVATLVTPETPSRDCLRELWITWQGQHPEWSETETIQVPIWFLRSHTLFKDGLRELAKRGRHLHLPVFKAWASLYADRVQADGLRLKHFVHAMDTTLGNTVGRHLYKTTQEEEPDEQAIAMEGAVTRKRRAEKFMVDLVSQGRVI